MSPHIKIQLVFFGFLFAQLSSALAEDKKVYTVSHFYKKEIVNGITFIYEEEVLNGRYKGAWLVDDRAVSPQAFEEKIAQAEKEACYKKRRVEFEQRMDNYKKKHEAEIDILKKLIQCSMNTIEQWLKKIEEQQLDSYLIFNDQTFANREKFLQEPQELRTKVQEALEASFADTEVTSLKILAQRLDDIEQRLRILVYESLNGAIKKCDDPSMLKKLLVAVEHL